MSTEQLHKALCEEYKVLLYKDYLECKDDQEVQLRVAVEIVLKDLYEKQNNSMG